MHKSLNLIHARSRYGSQTEASKAVLAGRKVHLGRPVVFVRLLVVQKHNVVVLEPVHSKLKTSTDEFNQLAVLRMPPLCMSLGTRHTSKPTRHER